MCPDIGIRHEELAIRQAAQGEERLAAVGAVVEQSLGRVRARWQSETPGYSYPELVAHHESDDGGLDLVQGDQAAASTAPCGATRGR